MRAGKFGFRQTFRVSGILLLLGLCTEAISLLWTHPIAFLLFIIVGGTLLGAGVVLFLYSLVSLRHPADSRESGVN